MKASLRSVPRILALLAAAFALAGGPAPADATVLSVEDLLRTHAVGQAVISPDGTTVAYTLTVPRDPFQDEDGPAWTELHVHGPGPDRDRGFVTGEANVADLAWTPDGSAIAFLSERAGDDERALYAIPVDGGEARRILSHETAIREYAFAPDGLHVAFLARAPEDSTREKLAEKGFAAEAYEEDLRPVHLFVAPLGDQGQAGEATRVELEGSASEVHWSPDGQSLAVALAPTPLIDQHYMERRIHVVDAASGEIVGRVATAGKLGDVVWSPDGARLALLAGQDINDPDAGRLMVVDRRGGEPRDLRPNWEGDAVALDWADATTLIYVAHEGVATYLAAVDVRSGESRELTGRDGPALRSVDVAPGGETAAVVADAPTHPREVFRWRHDGELVRLTDSNPWLDDVELATQEVVTYRARDGVRLEGLLLRPLGRDGDQRVPLIVMVHGGPESHYSNGWITRYVTPGQVAAGRGFAVFYPNYRGSTGRGVAFARAGQADYAGREFDDLVDGVEHLVDAGLVDRDRVGITGGSYGGYAAAWAATALSEHFAASVMFVGVSELVSKFGATDIPREMYNVHARKWPWDDWDFYRERSPVYHAQNHRTPLLILHGKEDPRVHPSQSLILYRYLKTLDQAPVRLAWYPGEGHGNRRAAARLDYAHRLLRWMEHYLRGPGGEPPAFALEPVVKRVLGEDQEGP